MFLSRNPLTVTLKARFCYLSCIFQSYINIACMIALSEITRVSTYSNPFLIPVVGEQERGSVQVFSLNCGMSKNQPESAIPRTSTLGASDFTRSATRSRFINTPVPPALHQRFNKSIALVYHELMIYILILFRYII